MESPDARHAPDDYAEMLRRIEAAHEQDVVEQALTAARDRLCMDAAYITTMDPRQQTIDALLAPPIAFEDVPGKLSEILAPENKVLCQVIRYSEDDKTH